MSGNELGRELSDMWRSVVSFLPAALAFIAILVVGYVVARLLRTAVRKGLHRAHFDRAVERGALGRALRPGQVGPSELCAKIAFYAVLLFVLQMAFAVWGPNPVSALLTSVIAWLPRAFVAIVIVVVTAAIAGAARDLIGSALAALPYGRILARVVSIMIVTLGVLAALDQVQIATAVTQPLLIAVLATVAGVVIVGVGGGLIRPMQQRWDAWLARATAETAAIREHARAYADERRHPTEHPHPKPETPAEPTEATGHVAPTAQPMPAGAGSGRHPEPAVEPETSGQGDAARTRVGVLAAGSGPESTGDESPSDSVGAAAVLRQEKAALVAEDGPQQPGPGLDAARRPEPVRLTDGGRTTAPAGDSGRSREPEAGVRSESAESGGEAEPEPGGEADLRPASEAAPDAGGSREPLAEEAAREDGRQPEAAPGDAGETEPNRVVDAVSEAPGPDAGREPAGEGKGVDARELSAPAREADSGGAAKGGEDREAGPGTGPGTAGKGEGAAAAKAAASPARGRSAGKKAEPAEKSWRGRRARRAEARRQAEGATRHAEQAHLAREGRGAPDETQVIPPPRQGRPRPAGDDGPDFVPGFGREDDSHTTVAIGSGSDAEETQVIPPVDIADTQPLPARAEHP